MNATHAYGLICIYAYDATFSKELGASFRFAKSQGERKSVSLDVSNYRCDLYWPPLLTYA